MSDTDTAADIRRDAAIEAIKTQRRHEEDARKAADDAHRESVRLWRDAQQGDLSYQDIAGVLGVTKGYVRKEVMRLEAGEL